MKHRHIVLAFFSMALLVACASKNVLREDVANHLAYPSFMVKREIAAGRFQLLAYERMHERLAAATVYIEGDGDIKSIFGNGSLQDPTPRNPVALHLASRDKSENLVWLARPCQYTGTKNCNPVYWGEERFAPEILAAYDAALEEIRRRYDIKGFNLVGFGGGGAIAAILAANRDDVLTLRTVAGNLAPNVYTQIHKAPPLIGMSPLDYAAPLANIPQVHFTGGRDTEVPQIVLSTYMQTVGPSPCVGTKVVPGAEHMAGWVEHWPELLKEMPTCHGQSAVDAVDYSAPLPEEDTTHVRTTRDLPEKP